MKRRKTGTTRRRGDSLSGTGAIVGLAAVGLFIGLLVLVHAGPAGAYFEITGTFRAEQPCPALASIRRGSNPGQIHLQPGTDYRAHALNKADGSHVHLTVPGADPSRRWAALHCGSLSAAPQPAAALRPFFDDRDMPGDPAPPAPGVTALDRAVLRLCGSWGSRPRASDFRRMLDDPALAGPVADMRRALADTGVADGRPAAFRDALTRAWFDADGFAHIFCGEPGRDTIGGLHYAPRYLQMQAEGWGGLDESCRRSEIAPPIYTIGVRYRRPGGGTGMACPKGYALDLGARELFVEAMRALAAIGDRPGKTVCLHRTHGRDGADYLSVFVAHDGAIRTFYPDASPSCDGDASATGCRCGPD